jgi:hypothetical protein
MIGAASDTGDRGGGAFQLASILMPGPFGPSPPPRGPGDGFRSDYMPGPQGESGLSSCDKCVRVRTVTVITGLDADSTARAGDLDPVVGQYCRSLVTRATVASAERGGCGV